MNSTKTLLQSRRWTTSSTKNCISFPFFVSSSILFFLIWYTLPSKYAKNWYEEAYSNLLCSSTRPRQVYGWWKKCILEYAIIQTTYCFPLYISNFSFIYVFSSPSFWNVKSLTFQSEIYYPGWIWSSRVNGAYFIKQRHTPNTTRRGSRAKL